jgi:hypothetical protein
MGSSKAYVALSVKTELTNPENGAGVGPEAPPLDAPLDVGVGEGVETTTGLLTGLLTKQPSEVVTTRTV